jgi:hypothetical protein
MTVMVKTTGGSGKCKDFCMHMVGGWWWWRVMTQKTNEDDEDARRDEEKSRDGNENGNKPESRGSTIQ